MSGGILHEPLWTTDLSVLIPFGLLLRGPTASPVSCSAPFRPPSGGEPRIRRTERRLTPNLGLLTGATGAGAVHGGWMDGCMVGRRRSSACYAMKFILWTVYETGLYKRSSKKRVVQVKKCLREKDANKN